MSKLMSDFCDNGKIEIIANGFIYRPKSMTEWIKKSYRLVVWSRNCFFPKIFPHCYYKAGRRVQCKSYKWRRVCCRAWFNSVEAAWSRYGVETQILLFNFNFFLPRNRSSKTCFPSWWENHCWSWSSSICGYRSMAKWSRLGLWFQVLVHVEFYSTYMYID